ncbi:hypothetical protein O9993_22925 [Vibrio lentus]|nr:hypothetical protein [Vibrio lentus]
MQGKGSASKDVDEFICCCAEVESEGQIAIVEISGGHTQIIKKTLNGTVLFSQDCL